MFYRVEWTVQGEKTTSVREYVASVEDAWELWYWLTSRSVMEPEYHKKMVEERRESALFAPFYVPPVITVKVYELGGAEVCPEEGSAGMYRRKGE